jgi:HEPN domain-containing protein
VIEKSELRKLAKARLKDSIILCKAKRYDGAVYICGYVIELGLKLRICKTLKWDGFPSTNREFNDFRSFKTHNLDVLLALSGIEEKVKTKYLSEWSTIAIWDPEARYNPIGTIGKSDAELMIESAETLLKIL